MRVLVCGGRNYKNRDNVFNTLDLINNETPISCIIEGNARGADRLAGNWACSTTTPCELYHAQWDKYGKFAGFKRNTEMLEVGKPDLVIAFLGGRGTDMMCRIAEQAGIEVWRMT